MKKLLLLGATVWLTGLISAGLMILPAEVLAQDCQQKVKMLEEKIREQNNVISNLRTDRTFLLRQVHALQQSPIFVEIRTNDLILTREALRGEEVVLMDLSFEVKREVHFNQVPFLLNLTKGNFGRLEQLHLEVLDEEEWIQVSFPQDVAVFSWRRPRITFGYWNVLNLKKGENRVRLVGIFADDSDPMFEVTPILMVRDMKGYFVPGKGVKGINPQLKDSGLSKETAINPYEDIFPFVGYIVGNSRRAPTTRPAKGLKK